MQAAAVFFDGETARDRNVTLRIAGSDLQFSGDDLSPQTWSISGLHPIDPPTEGQPFRITHDSKPGARLIIRDQSFIDALVAANGHLKGGYSWRHLGQVAGWTIGGLAALAAFIYFTMTVLPKQVAGLIPQDMRDTAGSQVVTSLVGTARQCEGVGSRDAIAAMVSALAEGDADLPPIEVEIYDMELVNAFAVPGGRIILTRGLIKEASSADEVTGVLAHELGHVYHLHPEAQLVRLFGLQILMSAFTGGGNGDWISGAAGLATILRYSREAEREADSFARDVMTKASVNPLGLRAFFEKILKMDGGKPVDATKADSALDQIGNLFSTHPGTEERIKQIEPLPAGQTPKQVMTPQQWEALRNACN